MGKNNKKLMSLTEGDFGKIADLLHGTLDTRLAVLASKKDLNELKIELKKYSQEGVETIMAELENIEEQLEEKEELKKLKLWAVKASQKIGVEYKV